MELFADQPPPLAGPCVEPLGDGAMLLRGFAPVTAETSWREIGRVVEAAPLRGVPQAELDQGAALSVVTLPSSPPASASARSG